MNPGFHPIAGDAAVVIDAAKRDYAGFKVEEISVRARDNGKGPRHVIGFGLSGRR